MTVVSGDLETINVAKPGDFLEQLQECGGWGRGGGGGQGRGEQGALLTKAGISRGMGGSPGLVEICKGGVEGVLKGSECPEAG